MLHHIPCFCDTFKPNFSEALQPNSEVILQIF